MVQSTLIQQGLIETYNLYVAKFDQIIELTSDSTALSDIHFLGIPPEHNESIETHGKWPLLKLFHKLTKVKHIILRIIYSALLGKDRWTHTSTEQYHQIIHEGVSPNVGW